MELYSILIADDEEEIRKGIIQKINWHHLGFALIGEAENGAEAFELCEQLKPDVVLTDIKMPFMDGLELCRNIKQTLPACKMIVFSGFNDFEYARQAVSNGVFEYIMKPINASELNVVLSKLKTKLDNERLEKRDMETLRRQYEESFPILRELFFTRLLDGRIPHDEILERIARYELSLSYESWRIVLIKVIIKGSKKLSYDELLLISVKEFINQYFQFNTSCIQSLIYNDMIALIVQIKKAYQLIEEMQRLSSLIKCYLGIDIHVGIGRAYNAEDINRSVEEAKIAIDNQIIVGTSVLYIGDIEPSRTITISFSEQDLKILENAVKLGTQNDVKLAVQNIINRVRETRLSLSQCQLFFLEIITGIIKISRSGGEDIEISFCQNFENFISISDFSTLDDIYNWLCSQCLSLQTLLGKKRTDNTSNTIKKAKDFILLSYNQIDLSVDTLCDYLHLSPAYFSTLFKKETGKSFTAYVNEIRMKMAANMLKDTDEKTYLIAEKVGFSDPNYFSYVFKKHFGSTPSKYRSNKANINI